MKYKFEERVVETLRSKEGSCVVYIPDNAIAITINTIGESKFNDEYTVVQWLEPKKEVPE